MLCVSLITLCLSSHFVSALHLYISNCKCTVYIGQPTSPLDSHISFGVCHYVVSWLFDSVKLSARQGEYYERYKNIGVSRRSKIVRTVRSTCLALVLSCVTKMSFFFLYRSSLKEELPDIMRIHVNDKAQKIYFRQQATSTTLRQLVMIAL